MAITASGVWFPQIPDGPPTDGISHRRPISGAGAPSDSIGSNGDIYIDNSTGDMYTKSGDTWILYAAGTGGGAQMMEYTGADPISDGLTPTDQSLPAIAYKRDGSSATYVWNTVDRVWN